MSAYLEILNSNPLISRKGGKRRRSVEDVERRMLDRFQAEEEQIAEFHRNRKRKI